MNILPAHRRVSAGRTWPSMYRPESYSPISHYRRETRATWVIAALFVAAVVGIAVGVL